MRRLFWLAMGVTIGALLVRKLAKTAQSLRPSGVATSVSGSFDALADSVRDFADEVREAMSQREAELIEGAGIDGRLGAAPDDFA